nr:MAG TPA: NlpC/P60 family [Caudoviricetes sp.]DAL17911.1 MAG TPA_asm: NlpC/P60 family [Caudoviricetes sp.]
MLQDLNMWQVNLNRYLLSRHVRGGRSFPNLDCWGLVRDVYKSIGATLPEFVDFEQCTMHKAAKSCIAEHLFFEVYEPQDFDVIAFFRKNRLFHVGICYQNKILHTTQNRNCRYEPISNFLSHSDNICVRYYRCKLLYFHEKT